MARLAIRYHVVLFLSIVTLFVCHAGGSRFSVSDQEIQWQREMAEIVTGRDKNNRLWQVTKWMEVVDSKTGEPKRIETISYIREKGCGICYIDANDQWQVTDTSWVQTIDGFVMDQANYALTMGKTAGATLHYDIKGEVLTLKASMLAVYDGGDTIPLRAVDDTVQGVIDRDNPRKLVFKEAFGSGIHLELEAYPDGFHQNVILGHKLKLPVGVDTETAQVLLYTELGLDDYLCDSKRDGSQLNMRVGSDPNSHAVGTRDIGRLKAESFSDVHIEFIAEKQDGSSTVVHRFVESRVFHADDRMSKRFNDLAVAEKQIIRDRDDRTYLVESLPAAVLEDANYPVLWDYHTVSGTLTSDEIWYADATYYVSSTLTLDTGVELRIEPGTIVKTAASSGINAQNGVLIARGKPYEHIVFTKSGDSDMGEVISASSSRWAGLTINQDSIVEFCKIGYAGKGVNVTQPGNIAIKNNIFYDNGTDIYMFITSGVSNVTIFNNLMTGDSPPAIWIVCLTANQQVGMDIDIHNNTVYSVDDVGDADCIEIANIPGAASVTANIYNNIIASTGAGICVRNSSFTETNNAYYLCSQPIVGGQTPTASFILTESPFDSTNTQLSSFFLNTSASSGALLANGGFGNVEDYYVNPYKWGIYPVSDSGHLITSSVTLTSSETWQPNYDTCDTGPVAIGYHHPRVDYLLKAEVEIYDPGVLTVKPSTVIAMDSQIYVNTGSLSVEGSPFGGGYVHLAKSGFVSAGWDTIKHRESQINIYVMVDYSEYSISFAKFYNVGIHAEKGPGRPLHDNIFKHNVYGYNFVADCENDIVIFNNLFAYNLDGIRAAEGAGEIVVINSTFDRNFRGLFVSEASGVYLVVKNSIFSNNTTAIRAYSEYSQSLAIQKAYNSYYNNSSNSYIQLEYYPDIVLDLDATSWADPYAYDAALLSDDPYWQDWDNFDDRFYLEQTSQLVDAGDPTDGPMCGYTTDPTAVADQWSATADINRRDIGYHYPLKIDTDYVPGPDYLSFWLCACSQPPYGDYAWLWGPIPGGLVEKGLMSPSGSGWILDLYERQYWCFGRYELGGRPNSFRAKFIVEDSAGDDYGNGNCGGANDQRQEGTCSVLMWLPDNSYVVTMSVTGRVETAYPNWDRGEILLNGDSKVALKSTGNTKDCGMETKSDSIVISDLTTGYYLIELKVDTGDEKFHVGAYFEFWVSVGPNVDL